MSIQANIHDVTEATSNKFWSEGRHIGTIRFSDGSGQSIGVFTKPYVVEATAAAFNTAMRDNPADWDDVIDVIENAIADTHDLDVTNRNYAEAVVLALFKEGMIQAETQEERDERQAREAAEHAAYNEAERADAINAERRLEA